jgi:hypothetical protein
MGTEAGTEIYPDALELLEDGVLRTHRPPAAAAALSIRDVDPDRPLPPLPELAAAGFYAVRIVPIPPGQAARTAQAQRTLWQGFLEASLSRLGRVPTQAEMRREQRMDWLLSRLQEGARLYRCAVTLLLAAPGTPGMDGEALAAEARAARDVLAQRLRAAGYLPQIFAYIPEEAYRDLFPHGPAHRAGAFFRVDEGVEPLLPLPAPASPPRPGAVYLGTCPEAGPVFFAPEDGIWGVPQPHGSVVILGEMGARKTTLRRVLALGRRLWGRAVVTLDPKGEDGALVAAVGGRSFRLEPPTDPHRCWMHPFAGIRRAEELFFAVRAFWSGVLRSEWPPDGDAVLDRAVRSLEAEGRLAEGSLRLIEVAEAIRRESARSPTAAMMAARMAPYAAGGVLDGYFDRPEADLDRLELAPGDWVSFDLSGIRDEAARAIAVYAVTWFLYRAVLVPRQMPVDVFIDEAWRLFQLAPELPDELARELRGRGGALYLVTHLPRDLAGSVIGQLAGFAFIGRMPAETAASFLAGMGVPAPEALAAEAPGLEPGRFLAVPAAGRGRPARLRLRLPPAWLDLFRQGELR